ncbi:MAG: phenylacetate-CoA oxygenase subunit PaaJ [Bacteroidetes bacterium CHB5]|nr:phenylacetate-CoA oxygenase subunit PaaJ [Bacteroidetes bacterium CHB5]
MNDQILQILETVKDPEIPVLSLVDLGVITEVKVEGDTVCVKMTPTFVGCPAMDYMKTEVESALHQQGYQAHVEITFEKPWSSDLITEKGKAALKKYGLAPPPDNKLFINLEILETATCPRCNGSNTELKTPFGPTLCRAIYYCNTCKEAFEQFKPV